MALSPMALWIRSRASSGLAVVALCLTTAAVHGAELTPARIGNHDASIARLIEHPDVLGDHTLYLRCEAKVMLGGAIREVGCYDDAEVPDAFFEAVERVAGRATFMPAEADGEKVNALVLFTVLFRSQDGQRVTAVIPNHGTNAKAFGVNYIAPQRYGSNRFNPRADIGLLWADAQMDETGRARDLKLVDTAWTTRETRRYARRYINGNDFIPGFVDGEPTAMRFLKPIFGFRNGFMWMRDDSKCRSSTIDCREVSSSSGENRYVFDD